MFDEIEKIMKELAECLMDKHEIFEEINGIESANSYWESLSHNTRVEFLIKFLSCYFYYPENKMMIKHKPDFPKYKESKKMLIAHEEFKIIIRFILDNNLTGFNIHEMILLNRKHEFLDDLKEKFEDCSFILPFMPTLFTNQLINNSENLSLGLRNEVIFYPKVMNNVKSYDELIERLEYYIHIAYYHFIAKYTNSQIAKIINENSSSSVFKYNSDIKRILKYKDKKSFFNQLITEPKINMDENL